MARMLASICPATSRHGSGSLTSTGSATRVRCASSELRTLTRSKRSRISAKDEVNRIRQVIENEGDVEGDLRKGRLDAHQAAHRHSVLSRTASTVVDFQRAASARTPTRAPARDRVRARLQARRKRRRRPNGKSTAGCWRKGRHQEQEVQEARAQECTLRSGIHSGFVQQHYR